LFLFAVEYIMTYHHVPLALSPNKMMNLAEGHTVKVDHAEMRKDGCSFHLTNAQLAKLKRAYAAGKGATIRFSHSQLMHHMRGSGAFSDLLNKAMAAANSDLGKAAISFATPYAKEYGMQAVNAGLNKLRGGNWFDDIMGPVSQVAAVAAPFAQMALRGGNWFDDVMGPIAQVAKVAAPFAPLLLGAGVAKGSAEAKARMARVRAAKKNKGGAGLIQ
jgi:hypothetical protein